MATCGCAGAFGSGGFGAVPWGSGYGIGICSARIRALNAIEVTFAGVPLANDPGFVNDATNVDNWSLTLVSPAGCCVPFVQFVERVSASVIAVYFDADLCDGATYTLSVAPNVVDIYGNTLDPTCLDAEAVGISAIIPFSTVPGRELRNDLANPQVATDAITPLSLGTFQLTETRDLALERGGAYLRKRVLRRLSTLQGSFFHLPGYGAGARLKTNITPDKLRRIQSEARTQILREPDVTACEVSVTRDPAFPNVVNVVARVRSRDGGVDSVGHSFEVDNG